MKLKLWTKILILSIVAIIALASGILVYKGNNIIGEGNGESYSYNISRNTDYKVYLVDNSHYDTPYLSPKNNPGIDQYASSLIDYIDLDFNYNYSQSKLKTFYTSYSVKAVITGEYENSKSTSSGELWRKNYTLLNDSDVISENTSTYNIKQNVKINYNSYNTEVNKYRAATHLSIDAKLKVVMQINTYNVPFDSPDFDRSKPASKDEITINIPLTASATKIEKAYEAVSSGIATPTQEKLRDISITTFGIIGAVVAGITFVVLFLIFFKDGRSGYEKRLDKIMKNYSDIIAEVEDNNKVTDGESYIDIKNFEDLVDIEEELKTPILYYEIKPGSESWFIIKSLPAYRYVLKRIGKKGWK